MNTKSSHASSEAATARAQDTEPPFVYFASGRRRGASLQHSPHLILLVPHISTILMDSMALIRSMPSSYAWDAGYVADKEYLG